PSPSQALLSYNQQLRHPGDGVLAHAPEPKKSGGDDPCDMRDGACGSRARRLLPQLEDQVMTVVTISTPKVVTANSTPGVTLTLGDTLHVLATGGIVTNGTSSPAILAAGGNSVDINSGIAATATFSNAIVFNAGNNDIDIGAAGTVFGQ